MFTKKELNTIHDSIVFEIQYTKADIDWGLYEDEKFIMNYYNNLQNVLKKFEENYEKLLDK